MDDEHVDLLELSTLRSALGSAVEEILDDNFGDKETVFFSDHPKSSSIEKADSFFSRPISLKDLK